MYSPLGGCVCMHAHRRVWSLQIDIGTEKTQGHVFGGSGKIEIWE